MPEREVDAGLLADVDSASYALIARILKEDRAVTPDADLRSLLHAFEPQECPSVPCNDFSIRITRDSKGGAGFAFDCSSLRISAVNRGRRELSSMQLGDAIIAVNDHPVSNAHDYHSMARGIQSFRLTLRRSDNPSPPAQPKAAAKLASKSAAKAAAKGKAKACPRGPSEAERRQMTLDVDNMSYEELLALDEVFSPVKRPGLADSLVEQLAVEHICGGGGECAICLEDFYDGDAVTCLPCSHMFHIRCAQEWLKLQSRCPYCNLDLAER